MQNKNETQTDIWVNELAKDAGIELFPQGSHLDSVEKSLATASKTGSGSRGYPDFTSLIRTNNDEFLLVIENKKTTNKHISLTKENVIDSSIEAVRNYAVNGAIYYGKHLAKDKNVPFKKIFAIGISGNEKLHRISPYFIDDSGQYIELNEIDTLINFSSQNIGRYYINEVLNEETSTQKESNEIQKLAKDLHEQLRTYGNLQEKDKPLVVSGILLALRESEYGGFDVKNLTGDKYKTDGEKIFEAIDSNLKRSNVGPAVKKDKLLSQFSIIKDNLHINSIHSDLGTTPLKAFTLFLYRHIYNDIRFTQSVHDYIGSFYSEFMSYGGDGQGLGIVLTPSHITELFCDLVDLKPTDRVFDPCAGTGGFLIAAMHKMLKQISPDDFNAHINIKSEQLHGIEIQEYMFTIATTNMILRGDGKSNLRNEDFLKQNPAKIQSEIHPTIGMINPPYSMAKKNKDSSQYEINFIRHLLESVVEGGKVIAIVPTGSLTGKTKVEKEIKRDILSKNTLEGVITLNKDTFYGVGTTPCIVVFKAGIPHSKDYQSKFINFKNDGYEVAKHIGLIETPEAVDKKEYLLNVWFDQIKAPNEFCVITTVKPDDEWLHSFYYFDETPPTDNEFEDTVADYLSFQLDMVLHGNEYLFEEE